MSSFVFGGRFKTLTSAKPLPESAIFGRNYPKPKVRSDTTCNLIHNKQINTLKIKDNKIKIQKL